MQLPRANEATKSNCSGPIPDSNGLQLPMISF